MHTADEPPPAAPPTVESPPDDQPAPPVAFPELLEVGALQPTIALTVVFGLTGNRSGSSLLAHHWHHCRQRCRWSYHQNRRPQR